MIKKYDICIFFAAGLRPGPAGKRPTVASWSHWHGQRAANASPADLRDPTRVRSRLARPGAPAAAIDAVTAPSYLVQPFSVEFLREYWLHFELTSVLLLAAVVAAIAVIRSGRRSDG